MNTNFFQLLYDLTANVELKINIGRLGNDKLIVSVLPVNSELKDEAKNFIQPMILKGTAQELDEGFINAIQEPLTKTVSLFANMDNYLKTLEQARQQSQMERENRDKEEKAKTERKKKYEAAMQKVTELETKEKWGEAIGAMPKANEFPEQAEAINKKMEELRQKHGQLSLL